MKGKIAFVLGAATGYVLGTRAGRERYEQIKRGAKSVWATAPVQSGVTAVKDTVGDRVEAAQQAVVRGGKDLFVAIIRRTEKANGSATHGAAANAHAAGDRGSGTKSSTVVATTQTAATTVTPADVAAASQQSDSAGHSAAANEARPAKADATES